MITLECISKAYHARNKKHVVFDGVSLTIERGQRLGIMGHNGSGKSTLARVMTGVERADTGTVRREMSVSWPLAFAGAFQSSLTGADNARFIARIYGVPVQRTIDFVNDFAELGEYFYMPVRTYSSGMRARLAFASSLAVEFDCLVIDEVTAVGDQRFTQRCHDALHERSARCSLVMISHQPSTLQSFCEMGAVLHDGHLTAYGTIDEAIAAYGAL